MLDAAGRRAMRQAAHPVTALAALAVLQALLRDVSKPATAGMAAAAIASPESRGDRHATPPSPDLQPASPTRTRAHGSSDGASRPAELDGPAGSDAAEADGALDPPPRILRGRRGAGSERRR